MSEVEIVTLFNRAIEETLIISAPVLIISVIVGLAISIIQAATSIQEQTLTFVPKLIAVFVILIISGDFVLNHFSLYAKSLFEQVSSLYR